MSSPYLGSLMSAAFNFAPRGWIVCSGQTLPINQYQALFSLLGTTFGGNGTTNFLLPNLQSRTPISSGTGPSLPTYNLAQTGGEEQHTLLTGEMAMHNHNLSASNANAATSRPSGATPGVTAAANPIYGPAQSLGAMNPNMLTLTGNSAPHENRQPFLVINWVIALTGIFPTQT